MDDLNLIRDLGRELDREPPATLVRQRSRLAQAPPRRRRPVPLVIAAAALATAALVLVPALLRQNGAARTTDRPGTAKAVNLLLVGADGVRGAPRADSIVLVHLPADRRRVTVVSLPRDLRAPAACPGVPADGRLSGTIPGRAVSCVTRNVEALTNVRVDHVAILGYAALVEMVDAVGGVEVVLPRAVDDPASGLKLSAGRHLVRGGQALAYARARHGLGDGSDLDRVRRQQALMAALARAARAKVANPVTLARLLNAASSGMVADHALTPAVLRDLARSLERTDPAKARYRVAPVVPDPRDPTRLLLDEKRAPALFRTLK
ncbi:Biofilm regulatory protein A precursor [Actinomadura rubteroloni]|uniref:Biofilm regulatory protein A n=1 Tax=Actinomadura rubteroloni TaxID=1926885 RepID=A0A2P4UR21_9ACTN|nr:LCP family protein [Actinomadura rubteroloni]POM27491.1 Biofilm regulatory protein A precursor [Actinomadura rubteroloni]